MKLRPIEDYKIFRDKFSNAFDKLQKANPLFDLFLLKALKLKQGYVVGGYLRDLANDVSPRDIDIMLSVSDSELQTLIDDLSLTYKKNRFNGYKIQFENFELDCWSFDSNWAFKKNLLKSSLPTIDNIANGTFLNFDSLVLNIHTLKVNLKNYNRCVTENTLDILRKNSRYKMFNPTKEANIIRCLYLSKKYNLLLSKQLKNYILDHIQTFNLLYGTYENRLFEFQQKYPKYASAFSLNEYNVIITQMQDELRHSQHNNKGQINISFG